RVAAFGRRRSHRYEYGLALPRGRLQVAGKLDALSPVPGQQLGQKFLMNRHLAVTQCREFTLVVIDQDNLVPQIRKTRARHQPNVPRSDHRDAHSEPALLEFSFAPPARRCALSYCSSLSSPDRLSIVINEGNSPGMGSRISQKIVTAITVRVRTGVSPVQGAQGQPPPGCP